MARPKKEGLDYFPLDVDIDQDDKVVIIIAQYGMEGFGVLIKLMMEIYKNGYFYNWTEKEQIIFSSRVNVNINTVRCIVNDCIKWGLFNEDVFNNYKILTSKGIQTRYLLATSRRLDTLIKEEYLLTEVNVYRNSKSLDKKDNINPQSKVKEKKVKEKKEKVNKPSSPKQVYDEDSIHYKLALRLYQNILVNNPDYKEPNFQTWANDVRLMMERDKRTEEQIAYLMDWVQNDSFWKTNILCVSKLRDKYDQLVIRVKEDISKKNRTVEKHVPKAYQSLQDWADEDES